jgi:EAL domain-containing protein (putative c-di-GMP-specific phosphodiesterase class I)
VEARAAARRVLHAVHEARPEAAGLLVAPRATIGLVHLRRGEVLTFDEALRRADFAMYQAKDTRKGDIVEYLANGDSARRIDERATIAHRVYRALEHDLLAFHAQPVVDIRTQQTIGHELLLRLEDDGEPIDTVTLIDQARRVGLLPHLDHWAIGRVIDLAARHADRLKDRFLTVNVSSSMLNDRALPTRLHTAFMHKGLTPRSVVIELVDHQAIEDRAAAREVATGLRQLGVGLFLDDFGTAHGALDMVRDLPQSGLKVDRRFTRAEGSNAVDDSVVRFAAELGSEFALQVIATGIESRDDTERLHDLGVRHGQGFLYGPPMPIAMAFGT